MSQYIGVRCREVIPYEELDKLICNLNETIFFGCLELHRDENSIIITVEDQTHVTGFSFLPNGKALVSYINLSPFMTWVSTRIQDEIILTFDGVIVVDRNCYVNFWGIPNTFPKYLDMCLEPLPKLLKFFMKRIELKDASKRYLRALKNKRNEL